LSSGEDDSPGSADGPKADAPGGVSSIGPAAPRAPAGTRRLAALPLVSSGIECAAIVAALLYAGLRKKGPPGSKQPRPGL